MAILTAQPAKGIWTLVAIAIGAAKLPFWLVYYLPSATRPHPHWSYKQSILVQIIRSFLWNAAMVQMQTPLSLLPQAEKERWFVVEPAAQPSYIRVAIADPDIKPESVGGTWYPAKPSLTGKPGIVVLHFHGGAYVIGDGRTKDAGFAAQTLIAHTDATHVFAPQYRLSSNKGCRFPAALQDAITTYAYLVKNEGISPNKIVLSGDSAGANLALSLTRYLTENGDQVGLGTPLATWLWSPWVSPAGSLTSEGFNSSPNIRTDYITAAFGQWGAQSYQPNPKSGITLDHPYINFAKHAFSTPVPIYISTGECEVLFHDDVKLSEDLKAVKGNIVELQIEEHAVHDTILTGKLVGFEKEAEKGAKRAGEFLRKVNRG